jgi:hypothetical protein
MNPIHGMTSFGGDKVLEIHSVPANLFGFFQTVLGNLVSQSPSMYSSNLWSLNTSLEIIPNTYDASYSYEYP